MLFFSSWNQIKPMVIALGNAFFAWIRTGGSTYWVNYRSPIEARNLRGFGLQRTIVLDVAGAHKP